TRQGEHAPWYLPTFNHVENDLMTAASGHARDYIAGTGATDGETDGATHPGTGEDAYWQEGESYTNGQGPTSTVWPGALEGVERTTAQNLAQDRAPLTLQQWSALPNEHKIGDFWVIDHETGWAYWASQLQEGETSSYLLDAAVMTEAAHDIRGSYYYAIHVDSQLITPDSDFENEPESGEVERLLRGIRNNAVDDNFENPAYDEDSHPDEFRFSAMYPGRIFTMAGEQYRYLEDMGEGNHLIIRNYTLPRSADAGQHTRISNWYNGLRQEVQDIVSPVERSFNTGHSSESTFLWSNPDDWNRLPINLDVSPVVASDVTRVVKEDGIKRAFALSLADFVRLAQPGKIFSTPSGRGAAHGYPSSTGWRLRSLGPPNLNQSIWHIGMNLGLRPTRLALVQPPNSDIGDRPALIIHQPTN
ncbi:hypothetical protein AALM99_10780, partial [Lactococcus muris]